MLLNSKLLKKVLILIGLFQFVSIKSMEEDEDKPIKLSSKDKKEFTVDKAMIKSLSGLVRTSVDADEKAEEVPIPGVGSQELGYLVGNNLIEGGLLRAIYNKNEEQINKNLNDIFDKLAKEREKEFDNILIDLINASNYMDIPLLFNFLMIKFAAKIVKDRNSKMEMVEKFQGLLKNRIVKEIEKTQNNLNYQLLRLLNVDKKEVMNQIEELINQGADINFRDSFGRTPLIIVATEDGYPRVAELLLKRGADVNAKDYHGETALFGALRKSSYPDENGRLLLLKILFDNKPDVNLKNNLNETPLYWAITKNDLESVKQLVTHGANINEIVSNWGNTPLMLAIDDSDEDIIKFLLMQKEIDVNHKDRFHRTALSMAKMHSDLNDIVKLLKKAGAKE